MFAGFAKGKTLWDREGEDLSEDGLTALVVGALRYVPRETSSEVLSALLGHELSARLVEVELWPRWETAQGDPAEPDAVAHLEAGLSVLIEAKRNAPVTEAQLQKYVLAAGLRGLHVDSIICVGNTGLVPLRVEGATVICHTWATFVGNLARALDGQAELRFLAADVRRGASRLGLLVEPFLRWSLPQYEVGSLSEWWVVRNQVRLPEYRAGVWDLGPPVARPTLTNWELLNG